MRLVGRVALVTGAGTGIGRALALGLAREGADVVVNYHTSDDGARLVAGEIEALGRRSLTVQADVSDVKAVKQMFHQTARDLDRLDILVNNAGLTGWSDPLRVDERAFDRIIGTNLKGTFFCSVEAARI